MFKKNIAFAAAMMLALFSTGAIAEAAKHERVWAVTGADGALRSVTDTVFLENKSGDETLTDRTMLTNIRNLSGSETWTQDGETLLWQAGGKDITYQGTSDRPLPLVPTVTVRVNGEEIPACALKEKVGAAELTVSYIQQSDAPYPAVTLMLLPETGVSNLKLENAVTINLSGRRAVLGWAVPGADTSLDLPASFTLRFDSDHAILEWMLTFSSGDPIDRLCRAIDNRIDFDPHVEFNEATTMLTALEQNTELTETSGKTNGIPTRINELNQGVQKLNESAQALSDGVLKLSEGAEKSASAADLLSKGAITLSSGSKTLAEGTDALSDGLNKLSSNSKALNDGASNIFAALISAANQQLADPAIKQAGLNIPTLTPKNYQDVLTGLIDQTDPETALANARTKAEALVRPKVESKKSDISTQVTKAVKAQVLEKVLKEANVNMDAAAFTAAVKAGKIDAATAQQIRSSVDAQMHTEAVQSLIDSTVNEKIDRLVAEHVDEAVKAKMPAMAPKIEQAKALHDSLQALLIQLNRVNSFVDGLESYTQGVDQAAEKAPMLAEGAASLHTGAAKLSGGLAEFANGTAELSDGVARLSVGAHKLYAEGTDALQTGLLSAQKQAAEKLLPLLNGDIADALHLWDNAKEQSSHPGYDLRVDHMEAVTVFIIRTDME